MWGLLDNYSSQIRTSWRGARGKLITNSRRIRQQIPLSGGLALRGWTSIDIGEKIKDSFNDLKAIKTEVPPSVG